MKHLAAIIKGERVTLAPQEFASLNPADNRDVVGVFAHASRDMAREACRVAREAFPRWKNTPAPVRAQVLSNFERLLQKNKEALAQLVTREMGKPIAEARGDVQEAIDTCQFFIGEGRRLYGQTVPSEMPAKELFTYRRPIGVFACITAGNFPVAVPAWYFVPALLCGNTCVWKPSEDTPATSLAFAEMLEASGLPAGVFNVLFGAGPRTGSDLLALVDEGLIDKVGFTGSTEVGRHIGSICGRNLQTPCLELGGKNPMVVAPDANLELATKGILWSGFGTAGQRCTSLGNLIVHESIKEALLDRVVRALAEIRIGRPEEPSNFYGPLMSERLMASHLRNLETLVKPHHRLLLPHRGRITGKEGSAQFHGDADHGCYAWPVIVDNVQPEDAIFSTETFGPLFNVLTYSDLDQALALANGTGYGLSSSIYTNDIQTAYHFRSEISAGMTSINNGTTGAEAHLPFGGNGKSGNGSRQSGMWVLDQFTRWQAVNWDMSGTLQLAQMETPVLAGRDYTLAPPQVVTKT